MHSIADVEASLASLRETYELFLSSPWTFPLSSTTLHEGIFRDMQVAQGFARSMYAACVKHREASAAFDSANADFLAIDGILRTLKGMADTRREIPTLERVLASHITDHDGVYIKRMATEEAAGVADIDYLRVRIATSTMTSSLAKKIRRDVVTAFAVLAECAAVESALQRADDAEIAYANAFAETNDATSQLRTATQLRRNNEVEALAYAMLLEVDTLWDFESVVVHKGL